MRLNIYRDISVYHAMGETSTITNINNAKGNFFINNVGKRPLLIIYLKFAFYTIITLIKLISIETSEKNL